MKELPVGLLFIAAKELFEIAEGCEDKLFCL